MNKKTIITLSTLGIMLVGFTTPKPTSAFWPFDGLKNKPEEIPTQAPAWGARQQNLTPEQIQEREAHRATHWEEKLQALADFFGFDSEELRTRLENGEKPRDIAEGSDKTIEDWKEFRLETRKEHMKEMGFSEEEIQERIEWAQQRGRGKGVGKHFGN